MGRIVRPLNSHVRLRYQADARAGLGVRLQLVMAGEAGGTMRIQHLAVAVAALVARSAIAQPVAPADWRSAHPVTAVLVAATATA